MAVVCCRGECEHTSKKYHYQGLDSCKGAKMMFGGEGACIYGCLGRGDCIEVCPNGAISIKNGVASIDPIICIGCGLCAKTCPNQVIKVVDAVSKVAVLCNNREPGIGARKACSNACIGCRRCERDCPEGAISVRNNLQPLIIQNARLRRMCRRLPDRSRTIEKRLLRTTKIALINLSIRFSNNQSRPYAFPPRAALSALLHKKLDNFMQIIFRT